MKTIRKAGKSINMISLKASEIYQGRGDLKGLLKKEEAQRVRPEVNIYFPP